MAMHPRFLTMVSLATVIRVPSPEAMYASVDNEIHQLRKGVLDTYVCTYARTYPAPA